MVKAVQEALKNPEVLYPFEDALPSLRQAAAEARARSLPFWIFNLPPCVLPELEAITFSPFELDRTLDLATLQVAPSKAADTYCSKGPACLRCAHFERCAGYFRTYEERFGSALFRPAPAMCRSEPLPESWLRAAPPPAASALGAVGGQSGRHGQTPEPREIARITRLLEDFTYESFRVQNLRGNGAEPRWTLGLGPSANDIPLEVYLEPASARAGFLRSASLCLSYRGSNLPADHEAVLRALFGFLTRAGAPPLFEPLASP
jgi:hypothetical protein